MYLNDQHSRLSRARFSLTVWIRFANRVFLDWRQLSSAGVLISESRCSLGWGFAPSAVL